MEFQDKTLRCVDCGAEFIWTAGEQLFFADKQFKNEPKRCKNCKAKRATRMATASARQRYNQRPRIAETTFGILKSVLGLRQFLLRGLEKVKTEWRWACTAFNLVKLVRHIARLRAEFTRLVAHAAS